MSKKFLSPIKLAQGATNPATGSSGELFFNTVDLKVYAHNGTTWLPSGGGVTVSATAPSSPVAGDCWYDSVDGTLYVYYNDGDSSQWVEVAANSGISVALSGRLGVVETYVTTLQSEVLTLQTETRTVSLGGTGASTLASGSYLKGAGTSAITSQTGIPAADITSGVLAAARLPSTSIVQTVVGVYAGGESGNSTSTYADTGLTATITPTSSTSKILILISQALLRNSNSSISANYRLLRDGTSITTLGSGILQLASGSEWNGMQSFFYQDSPASASALVYKTQFASANNASVIVANRGAAAYMILMEVKA